MRPGEEEEVGLEDKGRYFLELQEQIRESVSRADHSLLAYSIHEDAMERQARAADAHRPPSPHQTAIPDDLTEIVPAVEKMAMLRLNEGHEETMARLVKMYNSFSESEGFGERLHSATEFLPNIEEINELLDEVAAHRESVVQKVLMVRKKAAENVFHSQELYAQEHEYDRARPTSPNDNVAHQASREQVKLLEERLLSLEQELEEEHRFREDEMQDKDRIIEKLKQQLQDQSVQQTMLLRKTAMELADSAESVEDTRLHIAYLSIQLRNAKELAEARAFDSQKWVLKTDYEILQHEVRRRLTFCRDVRGLGEKNALFPYQRENLG